MPDTEVEGSVGLREVGPSITLPSTGISDSCWADVLRLPMEFAQYKREELAQAPADGSAFLQLHFELQEGRTRLTRNFSSGQLTAQQVDEPSAEFDDMVVVSVVDNRAGIAQGDRLYVEITVGEGARASIRTQTATTVLEMKHDYASQRMDIVVGKDAYADVIIDALVPRPGSRFYNEVNLTVDPTGVIVYSEHLSSGSLADGESWQFDCLYSRLRFHRSNGGLVAADTNVLAPKLNSVSNPGLFGEYLDMAVVFVIAEGSDANTIADAMHKALGGVDQVTGAASMLPSGVGAYARVLGPSVNKTKVVNQLCWRAARGEALSVAKTLVDQTAREFQDDFL